MLGNVGDGHFLWQGRDIGILPLYSTKELLKMEQIGSARKSAYSLSGQFGTPSEPDVLRGFESNFASMEKR